MNKRTTMWLALALGLVLAPVALADPPVRVQNEVNFLLGFVEGSGCEFFRNGTWYDSREAQVHLRDKYKYLVAGNLVNTAEDFIDRAASESSISGQPYQVRCRGGTPMKSSQWLREELARVRTF